MVSFIFAKIFKAPSFYGGWAQKLLPDIYYDSGFQKIILSSLLLFPCASH